VHRAFVYKVCFVLGQFDPVKWRWLQLRVLQFLASNTVDVTLNSYMYGPFPSTTFRTDRL
jgi:hypothetical protein